MAYFSMLNFTSMLVYLDKLGNGRDALEYASRAGMQSISIGSSVNVDCVKKTPSNQVELDAG